MYVDRPPRLRPPLPVGVEEIPPPPRLNDRQTPLWQSLTPVATIIGYLLISAFGRGGNILFILPMAFAVVISTAVAVYNAVENWRQRKEQIRVYRQKIRALRQEMKRQHEQQRNYYEYTFPDPKFTFSVNGEQRDFRSGTRLWERRTHDEDFGVVRLGVGNRPSTYIYKLEGGIDDSGNPLLADAERLDTDSRVLENAPIIIPLYHNPVWEERQSGDIDGEAPPAFMRDVRSTIGLISADNSSMYRFMYSVLTNLATYQSPNDLAIYVLGSEKAAPHWAWAYDLPHCVVNPKNGQTRLYFEDVEWVRAPSNGRVTKIYVEDNDKRVIAPGDLLMVLNDNNREIPIRAQHKGRIHRIAVSENEVVEEGQALLRTLDFELNPQQLEADELERPLSVRQRRERAIAGVPRYWKQQIWATLDQRERRLRDNVDGNHSLPLMVLVVDLMHLDPDADGQNKSWLTELEGEAAMSLIMTRAARLGIAVFFLTPDGSKVPGGCETVVELQPDAEKISFLYGETGLNTTRYLGVADQVNDSIPLPDIPEAAQKNTTDIQNQARQQTTAQQPESTAHLMQLYTEVLSTWKVRRSYGADIPGAVSLMQLYRADVINNDTLNEDVTDLKIEERWARSLRRQADWPKIPLGMLAGQEPRELHFFADADGVHGMIAGSTGSGKSELLTTLVLSLAVSYDPRVVNFVLIDYKGGGAFDPLQGLPHVVDSVTNLRPSAVERMFAAIISELNRRQKINRDTGSKDIVEYRKKGLHLDKSRAPYPHLFIIIDEFAEMIANNPEYKDQLDSIARLGRALGVSLILAAQRPKGVTDQMRANIKFRICLRVENKDESQELLRLPDAAYLPSIPGRGYLQVGSESLELIQVGWTGADYRNAPDYDPYERLRDQAIVWESALDESEEDPLFAVLDRRMRHLVNRLYPDPAEQEQLWRKPWPDSLSAQLYLDSPDDIEEEYIQDEIENLRPGETRLSDRTILQRAYERASQMPGVSLQLPPVLLSPYVAAWRAGATDWPTLKPEDWEQDALHIPAGLADNPSQAELRLLSVNFHEGHQAIFGTGGAGKTTFLRSIILSLIARLPPNQLNLYLLDFGASYGLKIFEGLPHVAGYVQIHEREKIERVLRISDKLIETRKDILSSRTLEDIYAYNAQSPDEVMPPVLIVIDNFAALRQNYEALVTETLQSQVREGATVGVYYVITGEQGGTLGRLASLIPNRYALRLTESSEYTTVIGKKPPDFEEFDGRGVTTIDRRPLVFQVAQPLLSMGLDSALQLEQFVQNMTSVWEARYTTVYPPPEKVRELEERVSLSTLMQEIEEDPGLLDREYISDKRLQVLVGRDDFTLNPTFLNMDLKPHAFIGGGPSSGKTSLIQSMIFWLASQHSPADVGMVLVDIESGLADFGSADWALDQLPHMDMPMVTSARDFRKLMAYMKEVQQKNTQRQLFVFFDNLSEDNARELIGAGVDASREDKKDAEVLAKDFKDLARFGGKRGLHFVVAANPGDVNKSTPLYGPVATTRYGIAFSKEEAGSRPFHANVPRSYRSVVLPRGRGFIAAPAGLEMAQFALPYDDESSRSDDLQTRFLAIIGQYEETQGWRVTDVLGSDWVDPADQTTESETASTSAGTVPSSSPASDILNRPVRQVSTGPSVPTRRPSDASSSDNRRSSGSAASSDRSDGGVDAASSKPDSSDEQLPSSSVSSGESANGSSQTNEKTVQIDQEEPVSLFSDVQRECLKMKLAEALGVPDKPELAMRSLTASNDDNLLDTLRMMGVEPDDCLGAAETDDTDA